MDSFFSELKKEWKGKECYQEMIKANYHNKYQGEWPGFYLEYLFENFLNDKPKRKEVCIFVKNKKRGELDFDLNFNNQYLGDLKMHSNTSSAIIGNDKEDFMSCVKKDKKFWYVVLSHDTKKDKDHGYEVTKFWNNALTQSGKLKSELSYAQRMKYAVDLTDIMILEINKNNITHVSDFAQPVNSNGKPREMKIQIKKSNIDNFLIYKKEF